MHALSGLRCSHNKLKTSPPLFPPQGESLSFDPEVSLRAERTQCEAGSKGRLNPSPLPMVESTTFH